MSIILGDIQQAYYTAAQWTAWNGILLAGQKGIESDTLKEKVGDGVTVWNSLTYSSVPAQNLSNVLGVGNTTVGVDLEVTDNDSLKIGTTGSRYIRYSSFTVNGGLELVNGTDHIILQDTGGIHIDTSKVILEQLTASRLLSLNASKEIVNETGTGFLKLTAGVISYDNSSYQPLDADLTSWAGVTRAAGFDTFTATPSSANLSSLLTDKTGTGVNVFGTSPTFTQWITVPRIYGGTSITDGIDFYSTSGNGTAGSVAHRFRGGNNGAVTILEMFNNGNFRIPNNRTILATDSGGTDRSLLVWSSGDNITINGRPGTTDIVLNPTSGGVGLYVKSGGDGGIGVASPLARWHIIKTTEQLRVGYDTSNYLSTTISSVGDTTMNLVGTGSKILNVTASTSIGIRITNNSTITAYIGADGSGAYVGSLTAHDLYMYRGNSLKLRLTDSRLVFSDTYNLEVGTTTGTKIGTATSQKLSFWNATPIVQPTTAVAAATFAANTSGIADDTATFDGYTIGQVVKALRNVGLLA